MFIFFTIILTRLSHNAFWVLKHGNYKLLYCWFENSVQINILSESFSCFQIFYSHAVALRVCHEFPETKYRVKVHSYFVNLWTPIFFYKNRSYGFRVTPHRTFFNTSWSIYVAVTFCLHLVKSSIQFNDYNSHRIFVTCLISWRESRCCRHSMRLTLSEC